MFGTQLYHHYVLPDVIEPTEWYYASMMVVVGIRDFPDSMEVPPAGIPPRRMGILAGHIKGLGK